MDSFDVVISPKALSQLNHYIDYVHYTLLNDQAAYNIINFRTMKIFLRMH